MSSVNVTRTSNSTHRLLSTWRIRVLVITVAVEITIAIYSFFPLALRSTKISGICHVAVCTGIELLLLIRSVHARNSIKEKINSAVHYAGDSFKANFNGVKVSLELYLLVYQNARVVASPFVKIYFYNLWRILHFVSIGLNFVRLPLN